MNARETGTEIDRIAADWVARADGRELTAPESAQLDEWLEGDTRHRGAYVRARAAWRLLEQPGVFDVPPAATSPRAQRFRPMARSFLAVGAAVVIFAAVATTWALFHTPSYQTTIGEVRRVPLHDGSTVAINTDSRIAVDMEAQLRRVSLQQGEAWFAVAHDPARPFVVEAGPVRIRAVGTAFSVRRKGAQVEIIVTEGIVEAWSVEEPDRPALQVEAGSRALVSAHSAVHVDPVTPQEVDRRLAWRESMIVLDGRRLDEAAAEFNRFNTRHIVIDDPALAEEKLVGYFSAHDVDGFVRAVEQALGAEAEVESSDVRLRRPKK